MKKKSNDMILAAGADIKSRFCIYGKNKISASSEFGNLNSVENFSKFKKAILNIKPPADVVAFDMHPEYLSSQFADSLKAKRKISVQHHHAHIASVLAVSKIKWPVIGVAFDGTGYGSDGNVWGGEFMVVNETGFQRLAHFKYLNMPGGELAVTQPWRMAFSLLYDCLGDEVFEQNLECLKLQLRDYYDVLVKMIKRNINSPLTSSVGRLFDAVSSILGICHNVEFEAQAAIKLEELASSSRDTGHYDFDILEKDSVCLIGYKNFVNGVLNDINKGVSKSDIARRFHNSLAIIVIRIINKISQQHNLRDVVLSGGVFVNKLLFNSVKHKLVEANYNLIYNKSSILNDSGICLGQAYIASKSK